jgi:hypothetical protein
VPVPVFPDEGKLNKVRAVLAEADTAFAAALTPSELGDIWERLS